MEENKTRREDKTAGNVSCVYRTHYFIQDNQCQKRNTGLEKDLAKLSLNRKLTANS